MCFTGHNEQGKRVTVTNDASKFHRHHLSTDLRGKFAHFISLFHSLSLTLSVMNDWHSIFVIETDKLIALFDWQAFGTLSDKLQPLVNGVQENKRQWLELAQNVQNRAACNAGTNTNDSITIVPSSKNDNDNKLNNNNNIVNKNRSLSLPNEDNIICNGTNSEIPKIVGKIGRLSSQNLFPPKQNGVNCENFSTRDRTQETMDQ